MNFQSAKLPWTIISIFVLLILALTAMSCSPNVQFYDGPKLANAEVARLKSGIGICTKIRLVAINGKEHRLGWYGSYFDASFALELKPGDYSFAFEYHQTLGVGGTLSSKAPLIVQYTVEAGKSYQVKCEAGWSAATVWIEEVR